MCLMCGCLRGVTSFGKCLLSQNMIASTTFVLLLLVKIITVTDELPTYTPLPKLIWLIHPT